MFDKNMTKIFILLLSGVISLNAADINWGSLSGTNDWNSTASWVGGVIPTSSDNAIITTDPSGTSYGVEVANGDTLEAFRLLAGVSDGNELNINILGSLSLVNTSTSDSDYGLKLEGNTNLRIEDGGYLFVNAQALAGAVPSHIIIEEGGIIEYDNGPRRRFKFRGILDVYGEMNVINANAQEISSYDYANDRMNIYPTADVDVSALNAPLYIYNASNVICFGAASMRHMTNSLVQYGRNYGGRYRSNDIGLSGGSTADIYNTKIIPLDQGSVSSNYFNTEIKGVVLGKAAGGNAPSILNMYEGSVMELYANIYISERPSAEINLYGGSYIRTLSDVYCGSVSGTYLSGYTGTLNIEDGFFYATNIADNATIYIGNFNNGLLDVKSEGYLEANTIRIGCNTLSTGEFSINGGEVNISNGLIATNAALSTLTFNSGELNVSGLDMPTGMPLTVGNGTDSAILGLRGSANSVASGIIITNLSTLAVGGVDVVDDAVTLTADLVLAENSIIHCDLGGGTGDQLTLTGDLKLPSVASVELDAESMDNLPDVVDLITATTVSGETDLSGWTVETVGENRYNVSVEGNVLKLTRTLNGTLFIIN